MVICLHIAATAVFSQEKNELKINLNNDGSRFLKFTFLNQSWIRYNQSNPSTLVLGNPADETFDIGLRRTRIQFFGQISERVFFYTQFGMNNFNYLSGNGGNRKWQAFFHDALGEYTVFKERNFLKLGTGLTICNGLSRFTQPSVSSIMTLDVPVFAQTTVDQTDEFSRKLSVYARGQVNKLDYRISWSDPFPVSSSGTAQPVLSSDATFVTIGHTHQYQGFFAWNFLENEPHITPYMTGTYLGKKKILNLEAGFIYQKNATWNLNNMDTVFNPLQQWSVAVFADMPVNKEKMTAFSSYIGYFNLDYGKNYIRSNGIMNPANGVGTNASFSGAGNAYPMFGTGQYIYFQTGYKCRENLLKDKGTLMPYLSVQYAQLQKLAAPVWIWDAGINWLINGHNGKLSVDYQSRPVFYAQTNGEITATGRKSAIIVQYQVFF